MRRSGVTAWLAALLLSCAGRSSAADAAARALLTDASKGNCIICHVIPLAGVPANAFGNLGPSLEGVGGRLTAAQIRARIIDPRPTVPDTVMPAYGSTQGLYRVQREYRGRTILTRQEIEVLVAYLGELK